MSPVRNPPVIGTAGWSIPRRYGEEFRIEGTHLERYGSRFSGVEINSSFYRPHRRGTYERWAASVPHDFRFSVKLPKEITHIRRLVDIVEPLERFLGEVDGLGTRLGPILVQLPPSLAFADDIAGRFFDAVRSRFDGAVACEPRHSSWFSGSAHRIWLKFNIARVAADPPPVPGADEAAGWSGFAYYRLHGTPKVYYSPYSEPQLDRLARIIRGSPKAASVWCIFDNTALGAALGNALSMKALL